MSDSGPNTARPRNYPEDLRSVVAEALPRIADELEALKFLAQNAGLETLTEIGKLRFSFESFRDRIMEASEFENQGRVRNEQLHARTQQLLSELLGKRDNDRADFDAFCATTNQAIAEIRRKIGATNGSSNGAHL